jgi:hypothetical protein
MVGMGKGFLCEPRAFFVAFVVNGFIVKWLYGGGRCYNYASFAPLRLNCSIVKWLYCWLGMACGLWFMTKKNLSVPLCPQCLSGIFYSKLQTPNSELLFLIFAS